LRSLAGFAIRELLAGRLGTAGLSAGQQGAKAAGLH